MPGLRKTMQLAEAQEKMGRLLPSQQAFLNFPTPADVNQSKLQTIFLKIICGGYACGKTRVCLQNCLLLSAMFPKNEGMVMRFHGKDLEESVIPLFFEVCPESWIKEISKRGKTGMTVTLVNDSKIYFRHLHDAGGAGQTKSRRVGANLGWFFISQVEEAEQSHWTTMLGRLRNPAAKIKMGIADANPNGRNWVQRVFFPDYIPLDPKNGIYFRKYVQGNTLGVHVNSEENRETNGGFVTDDFFDNFIANSDPAIVERYIYGSMEDFTGKIYKGFSRQSVHVIKPFDISSRRHWDFVCGIDVGGAGAWSVVPAFVDEWGNLIITDTFDKATGRMEEVADWIKANTPWNERHRSNFVIDPENNVAAVELAERGIYSTIATKAVLPTILRVNGYFHLRNKIKPPQWFVETQSEEAVARILRDGCPRIFVFNTSTTWITEHDAAVWDEKKPNQIRKTASQRMDSVDATRYLVATRPEPSHLLIGPEQKYEELRAVSPISAREWEQLDRRLALNNANMKGRHLIDANRDFDGYIEPKHSKVESYDWN
jgi:hypothetical protein